MTAADSPLLDWPEFWDVGYDVTDVDLMDRYLKTCAERWKVMCTVLANIKKLKGAGAYDAAVGRVLESRSARLMALAVAVRAKDSQLANVCKEFSENLGHQPAAIHQSELDTDAVVLEELPGGHVLAVSREMALEIFQLLALHSTSPVENMKW